MRKCSLHSEFQRNNFISCLGDIHVRAFGLYPAFSVCLNAHLLTSLQLRFDDKSTQADANNHQHYPLDTHPLWKSCMSAGFLFLKVNVCKTTEWMSCFPKHSCRDVQTQFPVSRVVQWHEIRRILCQTVICRKLEFTRIPMSSFPRQ